MQTETIELEKLKLDPNNARKHNRKNLDVIKHSLKQFGQRKNVVVDKDNVVIAGNGLLIVAKELGLKTLTVNRFDLPYKEAKAFALADNRANELSEWDDDILRESLRELDGLDFEVGDIGFNLRDFGIEDVNDADDGADEIPEEVESRTKSGDIWTLGHHRIMCGDSTSTKDMAALMAGTKCDMVFTSPPYNAGIEYASHDDNMTEENYMKLLQSVLQNCKTFGSDDMWVLWNMGCSHNTKFWKQVQLAESIGFLVNRTIIWTKVGTTGVPVFQHTRNKPFTKNYMPHFGYEFIFTFHKQKSMGQRPLSEALMDRRQLDVWSVSQSGDNTKDRAGHPAAFPVALAVDGIELFSDNNVFEPFCGSGTTLIACEKTGRQCFGMEIDAKYCDITVSRWENFTGLKATLHAEG